MAGTFTYPPTVPSVAASWPKDVRGGSARVMFNYTGPSAGAGGYVTGGDPVTAGALKLGYIEWMPPAVAIAATGAATAVIFQYNYRTGKLQAFWQTGAAAAAALPEVDAGTDLSDYTALMVAEGRG